MGTLRDFRFQQNVSFFRVDLKLPRPFIFVFLFYFHYEVEEKHFRSEFGRPYSLSSPIPDLEFTINDDKTFSTFAKCRAGCPSRNLDSDKILQELLKFSDYCKKIWIMRMLRNVFEIIAE